MIKIRPLTRTTGLTFRGHPVCFFEDTGGPTLPADMDFVYLAKNFDGTKVVNAAPNSTFGDYLAYGTITSNGSGASCYLSNNVSASNYLYKQLTNSELDNIKAVNGTYTFFIRMMQTGSYSGSCGGIMSTRDGGGYVYMIRCENNQLQFHSTTAYNLGSDFMMDVDRVYKVTVGGSNVEVKNLDTDATWTGYPGSRSMGNKMTTFWAGYSSEAKLDRFYGFAGIPRQTNADSVTWSSLNYSFMQARIQNSLEPFILKFNSIAVSRNYTFMNQTSAPDYSYCQSTYPNWF